MTKKFGLIGYPIGHSYSKVFFTEKFNRLGLGDHSYELFEMEQIDDFNALWKKNETLVGLNVTVPHKESVLKCLDEQDASAIKVGAANVIYLKDGELTGFNTDFIAFKESLKRWVGAFEGEALVLGSGGAAKAVQAALDDLSISYSLVSRSIGAGDYTYEQINENPSILGEYKLIVNTTPLGMHPNIETYPDLPYDEIDESFYLYDLVYNPEETSFLKLGKERGAKTKNGLEMLELQAEESWKIWNS